MDNLNFARVLVILESVTLVSSWQYFTRYDDLIHETSRNERYTRHSEYIFGDCKRRDISLYGSVYVDGLDVLGKVIVRGWVDLYRIPVCIRLRAFAHEEDLCRSTTYRFQMCVPRITYCHSQRRFKYFYYEWYIPEDMTGGMNWMIYFYGQKTLQWVITISCWQYQFNDEIPDWKTTGMKYSEYIFGECDSEDLIYYTSSYITSSEMTDKVIIRGWLEIYRLPTCIRLRAYSHPEDVFRSSAYRFTICVLRITYCFPGERIKIFYYEWFLPEDIVGGLNWIIYFFGPKNVNIWAEDRYNLWD